MTKKLFSKYLTNHIVSKKRIISNAVFLLVFLIIFTLIDQLTKFLIFTDEQYHLSFFSNPDWVENLGFIGLRPLLHHGVTSKVHDTFGGFWIVHLFTALLLLFMFISIFFSKSKTVLFFIAVISAGNLGNMIDRIIYHNSVRDLFFLPWHDNGTFNLADIFLIGGGIAIPISYILVQIITYFKNARKTKQATKLLQDPETIYSENSHLKEIDDSDGNQTNKPSKNS
ncbi:signal peptidase II [Candidatus Mycoplasma pogonae]